MAKQIATLDVVSGGRVTLGLGVGARAEDYRAAEAPFDARRMRRMEKSIDIMRRVWRGENDRPKPPRLVTSCWFGVGPDARAKLDEYLHRYLAFLGVDVARRLARTVTVDSPAKLREVMRILRDVGTDELILVPATSDPDEVSRIADPIG